MGTHNELVGVLCTFLKSILYFLRTTILFAPAAADGPLNIHFRQQTHISGISLPLPQWATGFPGILLPEIFCPSPPQNRKAVRMSQRGAKCSACLRGKMP